MNVQRKTIKILFIIFIISLGLEVLFVFNDFGLNFKIIDLINNTVLGILTGAFLTLITTLILYESERERYIGTII